jgi:hypothetical protein
MLSVYTEYRNSECPIFIDRLIAFILSVLLFNDGNALTLFTSTECVLPSRTNTGTIFQTLTSGLPVLPEMAF